MNLINKIGLSTSAIRTINNFSRYACKKTAEIAADFFGLKNKEAENKHKAENSFTARASGAHKIEDIIPQAENSAPVLASELLGEEAFIVHDEDPSTDLAFEIIDEKSSIIHAEGTSTDIASRFLNTENLITQNKKLAQDLERFSLSHKIDALRKIISNEVELLSHIPDDTSCYVRFNDVQERLRDGEFVNDNEIILFFNELSDHLNPASMNHFLKLLVNQCEQS
jgi:hypothetical protein